MDAEAGLIVGAVLGGRYRLLRALGEGAAGTVWVARDFALDIEVAVKVLRAKLAAHPEMLARFVREADVAERMLSPHIVRVLARGVHGSAPYIVYELLEGEDLATRIARLGRLPLAELKTVVVHACRGLARAHAIGVLHRDVKPENLFVTRDADGKMLVKVVDFGVAELVRGDRDQVLVGTLEYVAPEVLLSECPADGRSDLYGLGVVAYECATGVVPYDGDTIGALALAHATKTPKPASELRGAVLPELDAWMSQAIHRQPDGRFASAKDMAETLHTALKALDRRLSGPRPAPPPRPRAASFVFEEEAPRSSTYSIILPDTSGSSGSSGSSGGERGSA